MQITGHTREYDQWLRFKRGKKAKTIERETHAIQILSFLDPDFKITVIEMVMELDKYMEDFTKNCNLFLKNIKWQF